MSSNRLCVCDGFWLACVLSEEGVQIVQIECGLVKTL